jgi:hypothetical protein
MNTDKHRSTESSVESNKRGREDSQAIFDLVRVIVASGHAVPGSTVGPMNESQATLFERDALLEALTPSAETKGAYIGEFYLTPGEAGHAEDAVEEHELGNTTVPWTVVKEIMAAILQRAKNNQPETTDERG